MKERDNLYVRAIHLNNESVWREYKRIRNDIVNLIRAEKDKFFKQTIDDNKNNSRIMWKNFKILLPEKNNIFKNEINFSGKIIINDDLSIACHFNRYFIAIICDIVSGIPKFPSQSAPLASSSFSVSNVFSVFKQISMREMKNIIKDMKNVGGGESGISKKVLCDVCEICGNRLLDVLNASLIKGVFPKKWKKSVVVPVPKVHNTKPSHQFRPINTVEAYEKVLELVVKKQLLQHCDLNNILVSNQSGFRHNHSCETVLVNICNTFVKCLDKGNFVLAVFLDLKRAFETVDRNMLMRKLHEYVIRGTVYNWFKSYLTNRTQTVNFKNVTSNEMFVNFGVPQGTVLGPYCF